MVDPVDKMYYLFERKIALVKAAWDSSVSEVILKPAIYSLVDLRENGENFRVENELTLCWALKVLVIIP